MGGAKLGHSLPYSVLPMLAMVVYITVPHTYVGEVWEKTESHKVGAWHAYGKI